MPVALTLEHVSPVTRLLEKRKQMLQVQKSLDAQKDEYMRKEELFKRREENLRKKDLELQEALVLFNKFLKENEAKRRRADHRANEEVKKTQKWEKEIHLKKQDLAGAQKKCFDLKREHRRNEKYQIFLQQVLEQHGNHFDEINSIMSRHFTLEEAHKDLLNKQKTSTALNETLRGEFANFKKEQYTSTLSMNNQIHSFSTQLDRARLRFQEETNSCADIEKAEQRNKRETTQIIMAVDNLFNRCRKVINGVIKHGATKMSVKEKEGMDPMEVKKEETESKLLVVKNYLLDFQGMVKEIQEEKHRPRRPDIAAEQ
eukprot:CAMPEP_0175146864 /NCGR_PEP_ID=MMETSP0087-20121206/15635_1 /TAXON_ID=136419 /ORGANISM="Unknown Unknown, Strain D1" /LENGTH=314 /DNA_ID=CAMNT_0016431913 /DNA_START=78 /DNA_END=1022 /DNA_ORIENTATION=+